MSARKNKKTPTEKNQKASETQFEESQHEVFKSAFITLMSIIQATALAFLVENTMKMINEPLPIYQKLPIILYALFSLMTIIIITYEYIPVLIISYWWFLKPKDIAIPLLLGIFEILPTYYMNNAQLWWVFAGILSLMGIIAYINTLVTYNQKIKEIERNSFYFNIVCCGIVFVICVLMYIILHLEMLVNLPNWVILIPIILIIVIFYVLLTHESKVVKLKLLK
jgi:hypothetical protein